MLGGVIIKEYCIYIRQGEGCPYILDIYNNIDSAKLKLFDMVQLEELRGRPYYVDNDFFDNHYNISFKLKYFCIKTRDVNNWSKYSESGEQYFNNSNILYLNNYRNI